MTEVLARAKLNLTLDVVGKRADGYHDLRMVMETVELADTLRFFQEGEGVRSRSNLDFLPENEGNLAVNAAKTFAEATGKDIGPLTIEIEKRIPVCAGMGGGSSDAAAVLRYLNETHGSPFTAEELAKLGEKVGADVPYCVLGGTVLAEGKGEKLTPLTRLPKCAFVLCKPDFSVSTPALFAQVDRKKLLGRPDTKGLLAALEAGDLVQVARRLYNVFEDVLPDRQGRLVREIKSELLSMGALGAAMTGTGSTVYGLFDDEDLAMECQKALKSDYAETFLAHNV